MSTTVKTASTRPVSASRKLAALGVAGTPRADRILFQRQSGLRIAAFSSSL